MRGGKRWLPLLVVPLLLTGCKAVPGWPGAAPSAGATASPTASGQSWVVVSKGSPAPSASARRFPSPSATPIGGRLPLGRPAVQPTPAPRCTDVSWRIGQINGLTVVPGPGTATVYWVDPGGDGLVAYRVTAIAQLLYRGRQREIGWQTVTPKALCSRLSATFRNLDRAAPYTFSIDAVFIRKSGDGTRAATVARTLVAYTT